MEIQHLIPKVVIEFCQIYKDSGYKCYLVGGAVRNLLLGKTVADYDFASDIDPENNKNLFKKVIPTGIKHGTVTVLFKNNSFEVTTFRIDSIYSDGRHPDTISYTKNIFEDLKRRDFTMNGIAYDPVTETIIDPYNGNKDIEQKIIRAIGSPTERFTEDNLRPLRGIRFACQLDFTIHEDTLTAITNLSKTICNVSSERIRVEFVKLLLSKKPSIGLRLLEKTNLLFYIIPELASCRGVEQKGYHKFDVLDHLLVSCDASLCSEVHRLASLFHDIGKPLVREVGENGIASFHNHEIVSKDIAEKILKRLKFPNTTIEKVTHLIRHHMFFYEPSIWKDSTVRRFIARVGLENITDLLALRKADIKGMNDNADNDTNLELFRLHINKVIEKNNAFSLKDLKINGHSLMKIGITNGKLIGIILNELLDIVLENPEDNTEENLKSRALIISNRIHNNENK